MENEVKKMEDQGERLKEEEMEEEVEEEEEIE